VPTAIWHCKKHLACVAQLPSGEKSHCNENKNNLFMEQEKKKEATINLCGSHHPASLAHTVAKDQ